jgi:hypothetical protein
MSSNYFGLAGNGEIIWYFDNDIWLKHEIIHGIIQRVQFGHRPLWILPLWMSEIYDLYLKRKKSHSASHAFIVLDILISNDRTVSIYMDYDGSVHIREDLMNKDGRIYYLDKDINNIPFRKLMENLYTGFQDYHHRLHNCKHFIERMSTVLCPENPFTTIYLKILHRNQSLRLKNLED